MNSFVSEMSKELCSVFNDATVVQHPGGHYLPASAPQKSIYQEFFKKMIQRKEHGVVENGIKD